MLCSGIYDSKKDIAEVDQLGYVDVVKAFADGVVQGATSLDEGKYNKIENPDAVLGKPSDIFDMMQMSRTIKDYKASSKAKAKAEPAPPAEPAE